MAIPFLGALLGKIADKGGDIIKELVKDKDLAAQLEHQFRTQISAQDHELKAQVAVIEKDIYESHQKIVLCRAGLCIYVETSNGRNCLLEGIYHAVAIRLGGSDAVIRTSTDLHGCQRL